MEDAARVFLIGVIAGMIVLALVIALGHAESAAMYSVLAFSFVVIAATIVDARRSN